MKKILVRLCSVAAIGLALTACNNDSANKAAQDTDNSTINQMVTDKTKTLDDSLSKVCDAQVIAAADARIDSLAKAGHKGAQAHVAHHPHATAPATPDAPPTKEAPKPQGGLKGKSDQAAPGTGGLKSKSDQANTTQQGGGGLRNKKDQ